MEPSGITLKAGSNPHSERMPLKVAALIAVAAILILTLGGLFYAHGKGCCGNALPLQADPHGAGPCFGLCVSATPATSPAVGTFMLGWLFVISLSLPMLRRAIPIDKPPA
jgi:hypothetical protein